MSLSESPSNEFNFSAELDAGGTFVETYAFHRQRSRRLPVRSILPGLVQRNEL